MKEELLYTCNKLSLGYLDKLMKENLWKAFTTIHAGIHHQMKIIVRYKFDRDEKGKSLGHHPEKWDIINNKSFFNLINDLFILGIIDKDFKGKIKGFNTKRNKKLAHMNIYDKTELSDEELKEICIEGIEIAKKLDEVIRKILFPENKSKEQA